ncbi:MULTISPECIES: hypothetical protein [unclassified Rhodococcus (in: high G+C Gram-positive bacteria)]|uniref:hypothetical protein n=1 Tax=unclassified Rhodococcus (in: high G+C Gram-positive bacteria) TaxID=192944 RepID=UPI00163A348A|nr:MULTISPECIES: hypothetical protein [unclassified Rhodococcus (in: high G+C Gram-positive bacteria)]MBC2638063.1 hypothetical protein [Rhodococcus sp. 3A]MBC2897190.1 hypothetical protein [Rhodococcus sp. 4CII]
MSFVNTRTATAVAAGAALGFGMLVAQSATAAAAPAQSSYPQVVSPQSELSPYQVQVRDRIGCANAWPMVSCDAPDEDVPPQVTLVEPGTDLVDPGTSLFGPAAASVESLSAGALHQVYYPLEPDDGVISHPLDPDMPWM